MEWPRPFSSGWRFLLLALGSLLLPAPAAAQLDLGNVSISITHLNPDDGPADTYRMQLDAEGFDLVHVEVTPPVGGAVDLPCVSGTFSNDCSYIEDFDELVDLEAVFPPGEYSFVFNFGASSIQVTHRGFSPPLDHCDIDFSPSAGGGCTSTTPTFSWTCDTDCQTADELSIGLEGPGGEVFDAAYDTPVSGSVTLPSGPFVPETPYEGTLAALVPGGACDTYQLTCSVEDQESTPLSIGMDGFDFGDATKVDEVVVLPEASSVWLLSSGAILIGGLATTRRRKT